ncbi:MAG: monovalent cation/H(+) antiporter subunit G [Spirochaetales bacterium]|nr:monovalent cation/H(+) antiporter subunit G [Spirochaetales bacterium]
MEVLAIIGALISLAGSLFLLLAAIGIFRMPDTYNRMQTGTKATTLGSLLFFIGIGFANPSWWGKLLALTIFIFITNPLSSHVLARALHFIGKSPLLKGSNDLEVRDDLAVEKAEEAKDTGKGDQV